MDNSLELTFALKHLDQHQQANDANVKKLIKLQQRIISKEKRTPLLSMFITHF